MTRLCSVSFLLSLLVCCLPRPAAAVDDWQPIRQDELKMAFDPAHPMDAVILYHEETTDDNRGNANYYLRVKILSEKGKDRGNVEIVYDGTAVHITDVKARTIAPDGTITPFTGKAFDSTIIKGPGIKYLAKTFTLPNVQVGSIIEWKYTKYWDDRSVYAPHWTVQSDLPQKRAKFTFIPLLKANTLVEDERGQALDHVYYSLIGLPDGTSVKGLGTDKMELELKDVPAFEEEAYSPPEDVLKMRVNFYYGTGKTGKPAEFWKEEGKYWSKAVDKAIDRASGAAAAAKETVSPSDTAEQKVRKIYARVQKIKNLTFATREGSLEDLAARKDKDKRTLDDVLRTNEGYRDELVHLFLGMVRAVGIPAYAMRVADRDEIFFQVNVPNRYQLTSEIAVVVVDGKEVFLDPGTPFCPYGLLAWQHTSTQGLRQTATGTDLARTPSIGYSDAMSKRVGQLTLAADGTLRGKVALAWSGEEALTRRLNGLKTDEAGRKKELEDELKAMLPRGASVKLDSVAGWENPDQQITTWFNVEVPSFASSTGQRMVVPTALFETNSRQPFAHGERKNPVHYSFPFYTEDQVQISLPPGLHAESVGQPPAVRTDFAPYQCTRSAGGNLLSINREFAMAGIIFAVKDYPELRRLYAVVASGDSEPVVLTAAAK